MPGKNNNPEANKRDSAKSSYHHGDLARALITAGREILLEKGTDGLSLRAVAARVSVSQTAPYSHFSNKKELLLAISASGFTELADSMIASATKKIDAHDTFLNYGVAYIEFAIKNPDIYRLMFTRIDPKVRSDRRNEITPQTDILNKEASRAYKVLFDNCEIRSNCTKQATTIAHGAWGLVHGLASLITEGLIKAPETGRHEYLRELISSQIRLP